MLLSFSTSYTFSQLDVIFRKMLVLYANIPIYIIDDIDSHFFIQEKNEYNQRINKSSLVYV